MCERVCVCFLGSMHASTVVVVIEEFENMLIKLSSRGSDLALVTQSPLAEPILHEDSGSVCSLS